VRLKPATIRKRTTARRNLNRASVFHCEGILAKLQADEDSPIPGIIDQLLKDNVHHREWLDPDSDGFHQALYDAVELDSRVMWSLCHGSADPTTMNLVNDWETEGHLTLTEDELARAMQVFATEHVARCGGSARAGTVKRYCSDLWGDWHDCKHAQLEEEGAVLKGSKSQHLSLNQAVPSTQQLLNAQAEARLRAGDDTDTASFKQNMITDVRILAIVRYLDGRGDVKAKLQLTYLLVCLNYHRRAGVETYAIQRHNIEFSFYNNHHVIFIFYNTAAKQGNFNSANNFIEREKVMISCPLCIKMVRWLVDATANCGPTKHGDILWRKPVNNDAVVDHALPTEDLFRSEAYSPSYCEDWIKQMTIDTKNFHKTHSLGPEIDFEVAWPGKESYHINSATSTRQHAEQAMEDGGADPRDAKKRSGRADVNGDKSQGAYTRTPLDRQFALSLLVAVPRVIQKATDPLPRNPIPCDLLLNRDAGILVVNKDGSIGTINVDNIKRDALGAPLYRTGCGGVLASTTTAATTDTTTVVSNSNGTASPSPLAANPSSAPVQYGACRSHTVCARDCPLRIQGDAYFVPIVQKQQAEVDRLTALLAAQQKPEDDIMTMIANDPVLFDFDVSMPYADQPLPAPGSGGDLPAVAATAATKSLSAPSYAAVVSGSAAAPARVTAVKSTAPTTAPTNTTGGGSVDLSREEAMHSHVRGRGYDSNITEQEQREVQQLPHRCPADPYGD
jgi:hypothetical protein